MGRPSIPGEVSMRDFLDPEGVKNRTIQAFCSDVDTKNGIVKVKFDGHGSDGRFTNVPLLWASFPERGRGAWGRYMPCKNDRIKITFDYDDRIHAVGFDVLAGKPGVADGRVGWVRVNEAAERSDIPYFPELQEGEFDFMSIGGAYIHGSERGVLTLTGGLLAQLQLDPDGDSILGTGRQYKLDSGHSTVTFGEVRRTDPQFQEVSVGPWNPTGLEQEFQVKVSKDAGGVAVKQARLAMGGVASDTVVEVGKNGLPRRFVLEVFDTAGVTPLATVEADIAGTFDVTSTVKITNTAPIINVAGDQVGLGTAPSGGVLNGTQLSANIEPAIATALTALTVADGWVDGSPATHAEVGTMMKAIKAFINAVKSGVSASTSKAVSVT